LVDRRSGNAAAGGAEEVFEPPAALQSLINCGDQRRPPWAGLKGFGPLGTDELGKSGFPRVGESGVAVDVGGEGRGEVAADAPPQRRCGMIIRQWLADCCRIKELPGVLSGTGDCGQSACQKGCEAVVFYRWCDSLDERCPFLLGGRP